jgi:hypothetical protein
VRQKVDDATVMMRAQFFDGHAQKMNIRRQQLHGRREQ